MSSRRARSARTSGPRGEVAWARQTRAVASGADQHTNGRARSAPIFPSAREEEMGQAVRELRRIARPNCAAGQRPLRHLLLKLAQELSVEGRTVRLPEAVV